MSLNGPSVCPVTFCLAEAVYIFSDEGKDVSSAAV